MMRPSIFQLAAMAKEDAEALLTIEGLLRQLMHHHNSQAKPDASPVSREYHAKLADACRVVIEKARSPL